MRHRVNDLAHLEEENARLRADLEEQRGHVTRLRAERKGMDAMRVMLCLLCLLCLLFGCDQPRTWDEMTRGERCRRMGGRWAFFQTGYSNAYGCERDGKLLPLPEDEDPLDAGSPLRDVGARDAGALLVPGALHVRYMAPVGVAVESQRNHVVSMALDGEVICAIGPDLRPRGKGCGMSVGSWARALAESMVDGGGK